MKRRQCGLAFVCRAVDARAHRGGIHPAGIIGGQEKNSAIPACGHRDAANGRSPRGR